MDASSGYRSLPHDTQLFLGCTDEITSKYISDRSGVATIDIVSKQTIQQTAAMAQYIPEYKQTEAVGKRNILTPDEVLRLDGDKALVIIRGEKILKIDKYDFTRHPWSKKMIPCRMSDRLPLWRRRELKADFNEFELRAENSGELYFLDTENGVCYERTSYLATKEPEAKMFTVATRLVERNPAGGYHVINCDGKSFLINDATGESREIIGFDENDEIIFASDTTDDTQATDGGASDSANTLEEQSVEVSVLDSNVIEDVLSDDVSDGASVTFAEPLQSDIQIPEYQSSGLEDILSSLQAKKINEQNPKELMLPK